MEIDVKLLLDRIEKSIAIKQMTKEEFYAQSRISSASFSQWNTGVHKPTLKKIFAAAETLGVEIDYLLGRTDDMYPPRVEGKIVLRKPKLTEEEYQALEEYEAEETYLAAKEIVDQYEQKEKPTLQMESELSDIKRDATSWICGKDDETVARIIAAAKAMLGE